MYSSSLEFFFRILYSEGSETLAQASQRAVGAPSLEVLKARLNGALGSLIQWLAPAHSRGLELDDL